MVRGMSAARERHYWLFKSEPEVYSFADLLKDRRTRWQGVRNYQARNLLRDEIKPGDGVLFYHSNQKPMVIAGVCKVVQGGYPDDSAFDPKSEYYDRDSSPEDPRWFMVDIAPVRALPTPLSRQRLQQEPELADMMLLQRGARLSVQPVTAAQWRRILQLAGVEANW